MFTLLSSLRRSFNTGRARRSSDLGKRRPRPEIEALEARDNPSPVVGLSFAPPIGVGLPQLRVLQLIGDNSNGNTYTLDHSGHTTYLDGYQFDDSAYDVVEINTGAGNNDVININATLAGKPVTIVEQGFGSMIVNLAPSSEDLSNIQGDVRVEANYGTDSINLYDQNYGGNRTYTITATTVTWGNHATLNYNHYQNFYQNYVVLNGGYGNDTFNVQSTSGAVPTAYTITCELTTHR